MRYSGDESCIVWRRSEVNRKRTDANFFMPKRRPLIVGSGIRAFSTERPLQIAGQRIS
ncbi:hypothetical protein EDF62_1579 [Leucobacter luti]|uniref:Uncharacterized protein n=1 Tax=Leucobacter luti TaxID=340320 RepID=A0A4R6RYX5_9MICO|nr:hypothetical protein EDF62_1579 [Leucobacter luti]